jgi:hypothetical protein
MSNPIKTGLTDLEKFFKKPNDLGAQDSNEGGGQKVFVPAVNLPVLNQCFEPQPEMQQIKDLPPELEADITALQDRDKLVVAYRPGPCGVRCCQTRKVMVPLAEARRRGLVVEGEGGT